MNFDETKTLLAHAAAIDNRRVDEITVIVWEGLLSRYTLEEATSALKAFRLTQPGTYLEPGHLAKIIEGRREDYALSHADSPSTSGLVWVGELGGYLKPEDVDRVVREVRDIRAAIRAGKPSAVEAIERA